MGSLTVTYAKGRFAPRANRISVEVDGRSKGNIENGENRVFHLPDGNHLIVFRYSFVKKKVDLTLFREDSFTVSWDRSMGGLGITKEFEGDVFFDRRAKKYLAIYLLIVILGSAMCWAVADGKVPLEYGITSSFSLLTVILLLLANIYKKRSRTVIWAKESGDSSVTYIRNRDDTD